VLKTPVFGRLIRSLVKYDERWVDFTVVAFCNGTVYAGLQLGLVTTENFKN